MGDSRVITPAQYKVLHKVDSGGIKFKLFVPLPGLCPTVTFIAKHNARSELYKIIIARQIKVLNITADVLQETAYSFRHFEFQQYQEFWITWYNKKLKMGLVPDRKPLFIYKMESDLEIGYVQFNTMSRHWAPVEWILEIPPVLYKPIACKELENELCWRPMEDGKLPLGAMIGGFEDEPIYIARAHHNNSLCPGKYVPSCKLAYVPWGHREHSKTEFEILCGYNAVWEETSTDKIPLNAFIGGRSEVGNEPLYIGRAIYNKKLLTGKVHVLYKTCYLPYKGKEIETKNYEILVLPHQVIPQAITAE